jgi:hypothetical protein
MSMKRIFIATWGMGMILNVAAASAQGYPFGAGNTDMPWSVNQQTTAGSLGPGDNTDQPWSVNQQTTPGPQQNTAAQSQTSSAAPE